MPAIATATPAVGAIRNLFEDTFSLNLTKAIEGQAPSFLPLNVEFAYNWNRELNMGNATVLSVSGNHTDQFMFTMGIQNKLAFMARERFYVTIESGEEIYAYRVLMNMDKDMNNKQAALMLGEKGDVIIATDNWGATGL